MSFSQSVYHVFIVTFEFSFVLPINFFGIIGAESDKNGFCLKVCSSPPNPVIPVRRITLLQHGATTEEIEVDRNRLESTHWKRRMPTVAMVSQTAIGEYYLRPVDY